MSFYRWCLRSGAAILFTVALAQLITGLAAVILAPGRSIGQSPDGAHDLADTLIWLQMLMATIGSAAFPFFGALVIDRLDRRAAEQPRVEPSE
jgi:hypothetical protein